MAAAAAKEKVWTYTIAPAKVRAKKMSPRAIAKACPQWRRDPGVNPATGRRLGRGSQQYQLFDRICLGDETVRATIVTDYERQKEALVRKNAHEMIGRSQNKLEQLLEAREKAIKKWDVRLQELEVQAKQAMKKRAALGVRKKLTAAQRKEQERLKTRLITTTKERQDNLAMYDEAIETARMYLDETVRTAGMQTLRVLRSTPSFQLRF